MWYNNGSNKIIGGEHQHNRLVIADGMTMSEVIEQVDGYFRAALNITPPVGIVVIAADWRYRLTGGYNRTWLRVDTSRNKESSHDR